MITSEEIKQKAQRGYLAFLQSWVCGEPYIPLTFPVGKLPTDFVPLRAAVQQLQAHSKAVLGYGYSIESQRQQKRSLKTQTLPTRIALETATDFLRLIDKESEFLHFQNRSVSATDMLSNIYIRHSEIEMITKTVISS